MMPMSSTPMSRTQSKLANLVREEWLCLREMTATASNDTVQQNPTLMNTFSRIRKD